MKTPSIGKLIAAHLALLVVSLAVLYPILWVLKMALTPSQAFSLDPNPIPTAVTLDNFIAVVSTVDPPVTFTTIGTRRGAISRRFQAMASAWPRSSASSPG